MNKEILRMQMLAGIITEGQYQNQTENIYEVALKPEEKAVFDDLVNTLNEGEGWLDKLKSYAKKGMITIGILSALLGGMNLTMNQKQEVADTVKTEMPAQDKELEYLTDAWTAYSFYGAYKKEIDQLAQEDLGVAHLIKDLEENNFKKMSADEQISLAKFNKEAIQKILNTQNYRIKY